MKSATICLNKRCSFFTFPILTIHICVIDLMPVCSFPLGSSICRFSLCSVNVTSARSQKEDSSSDVEDLTVTRWFGLLVLIHLVKDKEQHPSSISSFITDAVRYSGPISVHFHIMTYHKLSDHFHWSICHLHHLIFFALQNPEQKSTSCVILCCLYLISPWSPISCFGCLFFYFLNRPVSINYTGFSPAV